MLLSQTQIRLLFNEFFFFFSPPSKTQPSSNLIRIGSLLFPFLISFGKCNSGMLVPINNETSVLLYQNEYLLNVQIACENSV